MKRLLIAGFLVIGSLAFVALAVAKNQPRPACVVFSGCFEGSEQPYNPETDYIFWQPINRLIFISK